MYGAYRSPNRDRLLHKIEVELVPNISIIAFDVKAAKEYGKARAELERRSTPIAEADLRIAAVALANDLILVTGNTAHFLKIPRLRVENWLL